MSNPSRQPIRALPVNYYQAHYLNLNQRGVMLWLNVLSVIPLAIGGLLAFGALLVYHEELGAPLVIDALPERLPEMLGFALVLLVLPLHEWIHGLMIRRVGHRPRYGVRLLVLFATADGAFFRRDEFLGVALAPLAVISAIGLAIMVFLPGALAYWIALAVALNAAGAIGDIWMSLVVLRFTPASLIQDEGAGMRIFVPRSRQVQS